MQLSRAVLLGKLGGCCSATGGLALYHGVDGVADGAGDQFSLCGNACSFVDKGHGVSRVLPRRGLQVRTPGCLRQSRAM